MFGLQMPVVGLDAVDYDFPVYDGLPVFNEAEWAALMAPSVVTVLEDYDEALALAMDADATAAAWLAADFE